MSFETASAIATALGIYFGLGALFALGFVTVGAARIDPAARGLSVRMRALLFPGAMLLWPLMAWKCFTQTEPPIS